MTVEAEPLLGRVALDELDLLGPRADEAHAPPDDVDELRQLVEAPAPQQPPDAGDPGSSGSLNIGSRRLSNATSWGSCTSASTSIVRNFHILNGRPVHARPQLGEDHRAAALDEDRDRDDAKIGRQRSSATEPSDEVEDRFRKSVEREMSQVVNSTTERSATWFRRDGGAEHPARGEDDAQLDPRVPAELEQVGERDPRRSTGTRG